MLVSGIFWTGNEAKVLGGCKRGDYTNIASPYTLEELEKTISKKRFALTREEIEDLVELVLSFSMIVIPTQKVSIPIRRISFITPKKERTKLLDEAKHLYYEKLNKITGGD